MKYNWDRISYSEEVKCQAGCNRPLTSGITHVIIDENGNELHCGKCCAEKKAGIKPQGIPNLTLAKSSISSHEGVDDENIKSKEDKQKVAIEYLLLRARFNHCHKIHMGQIDTWFKNRFELSEKEIYRIHSLRQTNLNRGTLSPLFLKRVWELQNILFRYARGSGKEAEFIHGLSDFIGTNLSLSPKQKEVLLNKIDNLEIDFLPDYKRIIKS